MRREELYLRDIVEAATHISDFIAGVDADGFAGSELIRSAVVHKLAVIGEAAGRVSQELRSRNAEIPWPKIISFRNILIHGYFGIDWTIVWLAASKQVPELRIQILFILNAEFASPDP